MGKSLAQGISALAKTRLLVLQIKAEFFSRNVKQGSARPAVCNFRYASVSRPIVDPALLRKYRDNLISKSCRSSFEPGFSRSYCLYRKPRGDGVDRAQKILDSYLEDLLKTIAIDLQGLKIGPPFVLVDKEQRSDIFQIDFTCASGVHHHRGPWQMYPIEEEVLEARMLILHRTPAGVQTARSGDLACASKLLQNDFGWISLDRADNPDAHPVLSCQCERRFRRCDRYVAGITKV